MKYMNIIKILSVLLCIVMLFVACDGAVSEETQGSETTNETGTELDTETEEPTEELTEEPLLEDIEADFENFFEWMDDEDDYTISSAVKVDGDCVGYDARSAPPSRS